MCPIVENKLNIMLIADTSVLCHIFRIVFISTYVQHNTSKTICEPFKITHELWEIFLAVLNRIGQSDQQMGKIMLQKKLWVNLKKKLVIFLWINTVTGVTVFCSLSLFFLFFPAFAFSQGGSLCPRTWSATLHCLFTFLSIATDAKRTGILTLPWWVGRVALWPFSAQEIHFGGTLYSQLNLEAEEAHYTLLTLIKYHL